MFENHRRGKKPFDLQKDPHWMPGGSKENRSCNHPLTVAGIKLTMQMRKAHLRRYPSKISQRTRPDLHGCFLGHPVHPLSEKTDGHDGAGFQISGHGFGLTA